MILTALLILLLRIGDVSLGTFRTILIVQGKKYLAGLVGFLEVMIWLFAMKTVFQSIDNPIHFIAYAAGFAIGNIVGITLEEKIALGYLQLNIISMHNPDTIANKLREAQFGVTMMPGEGGTGGVSVLMVIIKRRNLNKVRKIIESIDPECFITIQHSRPYRGFIHGARK